MEYLEFKGSQGEWKISEWNNYDIFNKTNGLIISAYTGGGDFVEKISEEMAEANAKLAAAAPDLLSALLELVKYCEETESCASLGSAHQAIEKALK